ncbi:hypothetical protein [Methanotorris formicicus]|uniref:Uncharacterized protein n=1 Tax=Methanotorris formicicus Mc-S-70 TaxID=647171 RepID=H1L1D3_9EURY|nr:hypothetical protein [Methanotorris formicicus]EHP83824.1 hypothetical protein MetfoDRAFT_1857 [Methanotorris formicicus Mc-S-70]
MLHYKVREIRKDRDLALRKEHTQELREKVVIPWIRELNNISNAKKYYPVLPQKGDNYFGEYYKVEDFDIERTEKILFKDFLENHASKELKESFKYFKKYCEKLSNRINETKRKIKDFLKENLKKHEILILNDREICKQIEKNYNFHAFEEEIVDFILSCLLCEAKIKIHKNGIYYKNYQKIEFCYIDKCGYWKYSPKAIFVSKTIDENKKAEVENLLNELLNKAKEKFKNDIEKIYTLVDEINKNKKIMHEELKKFEHKRIYDGNCEYIKYP